MGDEYPSLFRTPIFSSSFPFIYKTAGSEQMSLVQLFVPAEVAHDTVAELGELGNVQFKDVSWLSAEEIDLSSLQMVTIC